MDIKPENIMITREGNPVIIDFGLMASDKDDETDYGTPGHRAPERDFKASKASATSDSFAIGQILYSFFTTSLDPETKNKLFFYENQEYLNQLMTTNDKHDLFLLLFTLGSSSKKYLESVSAKAITPLEPQDVYRQLEAEYEKPGRHHIPLDKAIDTVEKALLRSGRKCSANSSIINFMNRQLSASPEDRLQAKDALKEPFIANTCLEEEQAKRIINKVCVTDCTQQKKACENTLDTESYMMASPTPDFKQKLAKVHRELLNQGVSGG